MATGMADKLGKCWVRIAAVPGFLLAFLKYGFRNGDARRYTVRPLTWLVAWGDVLLVGIIFGRIRGIGARKAVSPDVAFSDEGVSIRGGPTLRLPPVANAPEVVLNDICEIFFSEAYACDNVSLRATDTILDCGANIGLFAAWAAVQLGPKGRVVCFEPEPAIAEILEHNNGAVGLTGRAPIVRSVLSDQGGEVDFIFDEACFTMSRVAEAGTEPGVEGRHRVRVQTIDEVVEELGLERVDFIKMDIEGYEIPALRGARETLRRFAPKLAISAYHRPLDVVEIPELIVASNPKYRVECAATPTLMCFAWPEV
jgi:FkbM family methyltransferase